MVVDALLFLKVSFQSRQNKTSLLLHFNFDISIISPVKGQITVNKHFGQVQGHF